MKPYVKRGKTDAADAEAICEAVTQPTMRFVPVKTAEQQAVLMLHRTRDLLVRQRTALVNALHGHLAEFGIVAPQGMSRVADLLAVLLGEDEATLPPDDGRGRRASEQDGTHRLGAAGARRELSPATRSSAACWRIGIDGFPPEVAATGGCVRAKVA